MQDQFVAIDVNLDGMRRKFTTAITISRQPDRVLKRIGGLVKKRAKERIRAEGPGWAPLAASTIERKPTVELVQLTRFVRSMNGRSTRIRRQGGVLGVHDQMEKFFARGQSAKTDRAAEKAFGHARRRLLVLEAIVKHYGGAAKITSLEQLVEFAEKDLAKRTLRKAGLLKGPRYRNTEAAAGLLGGLADSIGWAIEGALVRVTSRTARGWSDVHNSGGVAGHGARIPLREYLVLEESDLTFAEVVAAEELAGAFN